MGDRFVSPSDRERFRQEIDGAGSVRDFEVVLWKKDGSEIDCLMTATRRQDAEGRSLGVQGVIRDITQRKRAEHTMRELAVVEERNRMAREIHDTLAQGFTGIVLQLEAAEQEMDKSPTQVRDHLSRAKKLGRESLQEARRSVWGLLPKALEQRSLDAAIEQAADSWTTDGPENVTISLSGGKRELPSDAQTTLLRICQESLTNIRRHAGATEVKVDLKFYPEAVSLGVQDNGKGFDFKQAKSMGTQGGFGLAGMEERARLLDGTFTVKSQNGKGTLVEVRIPTS